MFNGCSSLTSLDVSEWDTCKRLPVGDRSGGRLCCLRSEIAFRSPETPLRGFLGLCARSSVRDSPKANEGNSGAQRTARLAGALNTGCPWLQFVHFGENMGSRDSIAILYIALLKLYSNNRLQPCYNRLTKFMARGIIKLSYR